jgi:hypothetical protein
MYGLHLLQRGGPKEYVYWCMSGTDSRVYSIIENKENGKLDSLQTGWYNDVQK